jgi:2-methylcitrate dehydratase PrpD
MNLTKILHILREGEGIAPEFIATAQALVATLTGVDQQQLKDALAAARVRSDELHDQVQAEAQNVSKDVQEEADKAKSPK